MDGRTLSERHVGGTCTPVRSRQGAAARGFRVRHARSAVPERATVRPLTVRGTLESGGSASSPRSGGTDWHVSPRESIREHVRAL